MAGQYTANLITLASAIASAFSAFYAGRAAVAAGRQADRVKQLDRLSLERDVTLAAYRVKSASFSVADLVAEAKLAVTEGSIVEAGLPVTSSRAQPSIDALEEQRRKAEAIQVEAAALLDSRARWPGKSDTELTDSMVLMEARLLDLTRLRESLLRRIEEVARTREFRMFRENPW